ncbi:MAG: hypothetical protein JWP10_844 [Nocardioidaceae bacterium]|nr:hypothetical protein [Nocardioidaceae bacterium]
MTTLSTATATPDVTVKDVENLFHQAEAATEEVNYLSDQMKSTEQEMTDLSTDIARDQASYDAQKDALSASIVAQQMDSPLGHTAELLTSGDTRSFLDGLGAIQALNSNRADQLEMFSTSGKALAKRRAQLKERQDALAAAKADAAAKSEEISKKHEEAKAAYAELTAEQQAGFNDSDINVDFEIPAAGRAKKAISFALAQLGDAYRYGGTGPSSWDCSGLTGGAFRSAGISLPRSSRAQSGVGTPVSRANLRPGDLIFYYSPVSHVAIYLGNGKIVHAPRPGRSVEIAGAFSMPFHSARRVG